MERVGEMIRRLRTEKKEPLRVLAAYLQVDQAVMSKIETGRRKPTRKQVEKLVDYFGADRSEMLVAWLSDRIADELEGESLAPEALKAAEEKVAYRTSAAMDRKSVIDIIKKFFEKDGRIEKVWLFGSFARGEEGPASDVDLAITEVKNTKFSYFDLADVQYRLEKLIHRNVDIGFSEFVSERVSSSISKEAVLIYEKS